MIPLSMVSWLNAAIAIATALLAFRAMNRMNGITDHAMRFSFVLIAGGLFGEAFSTWLPNSWQESVDTLLFGGLFAAFLGTRRVPAMIPNLPEIWRVRLAVSACALTFVIFIGGIA